MKKLRQSKELCANCPNLIMTSCGRGYGCRLKQHTWRLFNKRFSFWLTCPWSKVPDECPHELEKMVLNQKGKLK